MRTGLIGGVAGLVSELFYFRDYWRPPSTTGVAKSSPEDFLFGCTITALSVVVYAAVFRKHFTRSNKLPGHRRLFGALFVFGAVCMVVFNLLLGVNSIVVSSALFIVIAVFLCKLRPDLLRPAVYSAIIVTLTLFVLYIILFDALFPHFWSTYWLLKGTSLGRTVIGIPISELAWYFSWSLLASICYPFVSSEKFVDGSSLRDS